MDRNRAGVDRPEVLNTEPVTVSPAIGLVTQDFADCGEETGLLQRDMGVAGDEIVERGLDEAALFVEGKALRETGRVRQGCFGGPGQAAEARDGGVVLAIALGFGGVSHLSQQAMDPLVLDTRKMAVGIHGEQGQVEEGCLLRL